jgi:hypothetical protein
VRTLALTSTDGDFLGDQLIQNGVRSIVKRRHSEGDFVR